MKTKCINSLSYFINKSIKDNWILHYGSFSGDMLNMLGFIEKTENDYLFIPLLFKGNLITKCE